MHKYPYLYQQCENTIGYDDMIERLGKNRMVLMLLDIDCMINKTSSFPENVITYIYDELIDFLDGNGFIIEHSDNIIHFIPIKRKDTK